MKFIYFFIITFIFLSGCDILQTKSDNNYNLTASFNLSDTTGQESNTFNSGESFNMSFRLINSTPDTLTYTRGSPAPSVIFQILREDSVEATSVDGYAFLQVVLGGSLAPGDTLKGFWKAPNTPAQYPKVILTSGNYQAKVTFPKFNNANINQVSPINFSIIK